MRGVVGWVANRTSAYFSRDRFGVAPPSRRPAKQLAAIAMVIGFCAGCAPPAKSTETGMRTALFDFDGRAWTFLGKFRSGPDSCPEISERVFRGIRDLGQSWTECRYQTNTNGKVRAMEAMCTEMQGHPGSRARLVLLVGGNEYLESDGKTFRDASFISTVMIGLGEASTCSYEGFLHSPR